MDIRTKYNIGDKIIVKDHTGSDKVVEIHSVTLNVRKGLTGTSQMVLYSAGLDQMSKLSYSVLECDVVPYVEPLVDPCPSCNYRPRCETHEEQKYCEKYRKYTGCPYPYQ